MRWYGYFMRREEAYVCKKVMRMSGWKGRGRPKTRWMKYVKEDIRQGVNAD